jgi:hypothetical protein
MGKTQDVLVLGAVLCLGLGLGGWLVAYDSPKGKQLAKMERRLNDVECRATGHLWQYQGPSKYSDLITTALYWTGDRPIDREIEGPWDFKCSRCDKIESFCNDGLTEAMRRQIRGATGCWPDQQANTFTAGTITDQATPEMKLRIKREWERIIR